MLKEGRLYLLTLGGPQLKFKGGNFKIVSEEKSESGDLIIESESHPMGDHLKFDFSGDARVSLSSGFNYLLSDIPELKFQRPATL